MYEMNANVRQSRTLKRVAVPLLLSMGIWLFSGCTPTDLDAIVLPSDAIVMAVSPNLKWITYEGSGVVWLASLPSLDNPVAITPSNDDTLGWSMHTNWMPDSSGILLSSLRPTESTQTWWLVKVDAPEERIPLCTLAASERAVEWSPTGDAIALISRGGAVTLMWADGS